DSHITDDDLRRSPESAGDPHLRLLCVLASLRAIHISQRIICGDHRNQREIHTFGCSASWRLCEEFTYHRGSSAAITGISGRCTPSSPLPLGFSERNSHITDDNLRRSPESAGDPNLRLLCVLAPLRAIHISQTIICGDHRNQREIHTLV